MNAAALSDAALDSAFYQSWNVKDYPTAAIYGNEIRDRLTTVGGFLQGLVGITRFPKYDKITAESGGYTQTAAAQSSTVDAVAALPGNVAAVVGEGVERATSGLKMTGVVVALVAVAAIIIATRK